MYSTFAKMRKWCEYLLDQLVPPRDNELEVAEITISELQELASGQRSRASYARNYTSSAHNNIQTILPYQHPHIKALIQELKYHRNQNTLEMIGIVLTDELLGICADELSAPILVPMPMHVTRHFERGYNPAQLICESTLHILEGSVIFAPKALIRIRHTKPQQKLARSERLKNVHMSMQADLEQVRGHNVIVVDDVTTTGATFKEARRALIQAGATKVYCVALAG